MSFLRDVFDQRPDLSTDFDTSRISQWPEEVVRFSSHYGSHVPASGRTSYSAFNLQGPPSVPAYGDHTEAMVLRTYGPWWVKMPSYSLPLGPCPNSFISEDFIDLEYSIPVIPSHITIRETYHPGSVVRILICNSHGDVLPPDLVQWQVLWQGEPVAQLPHEIRNFSPTLHTANFPTRLVRLEFNSRLADYYTELDSCELRGVMTTDYPVAVGDGDLSSKREAVEPEATAKLLRQLSLEDSHPQVARQISNDPEFDETEFWHNGYFQCLPMELWWMVLGYLDFQSLCSAARVNRSFFQACYEPLLYQHINLQPFCIRINDWLLEMLTPRFEHLRSLDISWVGCSRQVTEECFEEFLENCCKRLCRFRAVCSPLVNYATLSFLNDLGPQLDELDIRSCTLDVRSETSQDPDGDGDGASVAPAEDKRKLNLPWEVFSAPKLTGLRRLNLYGTQVPAEHAVALIQSNPHLEHVNVGDCNIDSGLVAIALGDHCKNLKSLDLWRGVNFSSTAVLALAHGCPELVELDFGWLRFDCSQGDCLVQLAEQCPKLTKLFLTAVRSEQDSHLRALADHCPDMKQLDFLGCRSLSAGGVHYLLEHCSKLEFLDISFCGNITSEDVGSWRAAFPHVSIKKSFN